MINLFPFWKKKEAKLSSVNPTVKAEFAVHRFDDKGSRSAAVRDASRILGENFAKAEGNSFGTVVSGKLSTVSKAFSEIAQNAAQKGYTEQIDLRMNV